MGDSLLDELVEIPLTPCHLWSGRSALLGLGAAALLVSVTSTPTPTPICSAIFGAGQRLRAGDSDTSGRSATCSGLTSSAAATLAMSSIEIGASTTVGYGSRTMRVALIGRPRTRSSPETHPGRAACSRFPTRPPCPRAPASAPAPDSATTYSTPAFLASSSVTSRCRGQRRQIQPVHAVERRGQ